MCWGLQRNALWLETLQSIRETGVANACIREAWEDCSLQELGYSGVSFTWDNKQGGGAIVKARLDRGVENDVFLQLFHHTRVCHIGTVESDHCFVLIETRESQYTRRLKQFRYKDVWQSHVDYDKFVAEAWHRNHRGQGLAGITETLQQLQTELGPWAAREFGCLARTVR